MIGREIGTGLLRIVLSWACVLLVAVATTGCVYRGTVGPNVGVRNGPNVGTTVGGEVTGEMVSPGPGPGLVAGATSRFGHDASGIALRVGGELVDSPRPWGGRVTLTMGQLITNGGDNGERGARFEARLSAAGLYGFVKNNHPYPPDPTRRNLVGVELFATYLGGDDRSNVLIGIGFTFGVWEAYGIGSLGTVAPPERER